MPTSKSIIAALIKRGIIPPEYRREAEAELHRELSRRAKRVCLTLATAVTTHQLVSRLATAATE